MDITYLGESSFLINATPSIAFNPPAPDKPSVVLRSERSKARKDIVNGPGEYEIKGALIVTVPAGPHGAPKLAHAVDLEGINVLFLDGPASVLSNEAIDAIGTVDILIIDTVNLQAAQDLARNLAPRTTVAYGRHATELAGTLGAKDVQPVARFAWNGISTPPKAVVLRQMGAKKRVA